MVDFITWSKWECEKGMRWVEVESGRYEDDGSPMTRTHQLKDGDTCYCSGCKPDHKIKLAGMTTDRDHAHDWHFNPYL